MIDAEEAGTADLRSCDQGIDGELETICTENES
jgi:hypothetical protein